MAVTDVSNQHHYLVGGLGITDTTHSLFGNSTIHFPSDGSGICTFIDTSSYDFLWNDSQPYTIEFWFYPENNTSIQFIVNNGFYSGISSGAYLFGINAGNLYLSSTPINLVGAYFVYTSFGNYGAITIGAWHHVALSYDGSDYRGFMNGNLVFTHTSSTGVNNSAMQAHNYVKLGAEGNAGGGSAYRFLGSLSNIRLTKGISRYAAGFTPPAAPFPAS